MVQASLYTEQTKHSDSSVSLAISYSKHVWNINLNRLFLGFSALF